MVDKNEVQETIDLDETVTISSGQSLSAAFPCGGMRLVGLQMPASWTAAVITFQASKSATGTFGDVRNADGSEFSVNVVAGTDWIALDPIDFFGMKYIKIRSGTSATPVAQGADRQISAIMVAI